MTAPIHNIAYDSASKRVLVGSGRQVILANWPTRKSLLSTRVTSSH